MVVTKDGVPVYGNAAYGVLEAQIKEQKKGSDTPSPEAVLAAARTLQKIAERNAHAAAKTGHTGDIRPLLSVDQRVVDAQAALPSEPKSRP